MNKKDLLFLEEIEKELELLSQDELYDLLVDCGMEGIEKLDSGKGQVILTDSNEINCSIITEDTIYKTKEINSWNQVNYITSNNKSYNLAA